MAITASHNFLFDHPREPRGAASIALIDGRCRAYSPRDSSHGTAWSTFPPPFSDLNGHLQDLYQILRVGSNQALEADQFASAFGVEGSQITMTAHLAIPTPDDYELTGRSSAESLDEFDLDDADYESMPLRKRPTLDHRRHNIFHTLSSWLPSQPAHTRTSSRNGSPPKPIHRNGTRSRGRLRRWRRPLVRKFCFILHGILILILALVVYTGVFRPSYSNPPERYELLRKAVQASDEPGRGNPQNQRIFIAASLYDPDGSIVEGAWGERLSQLVDLLGWNNVFLSIYENGGPGGEVALRKFGERVNCDKELVFESKLDVDAVPPIQLPNGESAFKRTAFLAEVRNKALAPFEEHLHIHYDKVLYLNDIIFDPVDALQLMFSTNGEPDGAMHYRAACAVDFVNPFKFYDTFATRDLEGYSMGLPFYPWFSDSGRAESRSDVLAEKDGIRVRSCWGGMVVFDARFFQQDLQGAATSHDYAPDASSVTRFRAEEDLFWDASECCLIHADIQMEPTDELRDTGIFMNPYVRVAYDERTFSWLAFTRRFERLYSVIHNILNHMIGLPWYNPRRTEKIGEKVTETVWVPGPHGYPREGKFEKLERIAKPGGFCGRRNLQVMKKHPAKGEKNWVEWKVPKGSI